MKRAVAGKFDSSQNPSVPFTCYFVTSGISHKSRVVALSLRLAIKGMQGFGLTCSVPGATAPEESQVGPQRRGAGFGEGSGLFTQVPSVLQQMMSLPFPIYSLI